MFFLTIPNLSFLVSSIPLDAIRIVYTMPFCHLFPYFAGVVAAMAAVDYRAKWAPVSLVSNCVDFLKTKFLSSSSSSSLFSSTTTSSSSSSCPSPSSPSSCPSAVRWTTAPMRIAPSPTWSSSSPSCSSLASSAPPSSSSPPSSPPVAGPPSGPSLSCRSSFRSVGWRCPSTW